MPCLSGPSVSVDPGEISNRDNLIKSLKFEVEWLEAALCAVITAGRIPHNHSFRSQLEVTAAFFDIIDFQEAGITQKQLEAWWTQHQEKDRKRKLAEAKAEAEKARKREEAQAREKAKQAALAKLTSAEKKLLGLK